MAERYEFEGRKQKKTSCEETLMGYISNYDGKIYTNKTEEINLFLKYIKKIAAKAEWVSSSQNGITTDWFHKCDEWLCYIPDYEIDEQEIRIHSSGKHYQMSVPNFCLIIATLDSEAKGKVYWDAEDSQDKGITTIRKGKVFIKYRGEKAKEYATQEATTYGIKAKFIREPKYDFIKIAQNGIKLNKIREYLVVENL